MAVSVLDIQVNSQGAVRNLKQVGAASNAAESSFRKLDGVFGSLAASFAAGFAINKIISDVKELDTNIRRLGTVGVDVQKINPALAALSDRLGGVASKADLAAASYQAASAGFADTAGNIKILEAATKAATGGLADNQAVTEVLVKTLNAYGMSGTQAYEVTDSISKAVELGNQEWSDYTSQLGRVVSIAAVAGVSIDEMNAFIAAATKNGATAEVAFTGLSSVLTQLLQPTKESKDAAAKLNVQWNLMGLQTKGLGGLMKELAVAIDKDKESAARMVGPAEAMRGAFAAASKDGKDFEGILTQLGNAAGKTDADFTTMKGSLENTFKALDTSFKNLSEALAKAFGPTLVIVIQDITKGVNGFATAMSAVPQPVMNATGELIKFIVQMVLVEKAIKAIIGLNAAFVAAQVAMAGATATTGAAATTSAGAFALYTNNAKTLQATSVAATGSVSGLAGALLGLASIGIITVGVNYVVTQVGAISGNISAINASEAAGTSKSFAEQLKNKSAVERKIMLATAKRNLTNDQKLKERMQLQIQAQEAASTDKPDPSQGTDLLAIQARINTNQKRIAAITTFKPSTPAAKPTTTPPPTPTGGGGGGSGGGSGSKPKKDTGADEAHLKNSLGNLAIEGDLKKYIYGIDSKIFEANSRNDKQTAIRLEGEKKLAEISAAAAKLEYDKITPLEKQVQIGLLLQDAANVQDITQRELAAIQRQNEQDGLQAITAYLEKQYELNTAIQQQNALAESVSSTLGQGMTAVFDSLIKGSDNWGASLQQIASSVLVDIANQLIRIYVIEQAVSAIKSFLSPFNPSTPLGAGGGMAGKFGTLGPNYGIAQRAIGGPVSANTPYMVGERGPELFMPSRGGSIIPNNALGGGGTSVVVNVDASGSNVQGDQAQGKQLGVAISAAVQAELVKQQRPGGLLAGNRR